MKHLEKKEREGGWLSVIYKATLRKPDSFLSVNSRSQMPLAPLEILWVRLD